MGFVNGLELMLAPSKKECAMHDLLETLLVMKIPSGPLYDLRFRNYESLVRLVAGKSVLPEVREKFEYEEILVDGLPNEKKIVYYVNVWRKYGKLAGLLKTDVLELLNGCTANHAAKLVGYARWPAFKKSLRMLEWIDA